MKSPPFSPPRVVYQLAALLATAYGVPALPGKHLGPEALDSPDDKEMKTCGAFGDPHVFKSDGFLKNFMGQGEYQLFASPTLSTEVHYYGCSKRPEKVKEGGFPRGVYIGAVAIKIGTVAIEIIGNDLTVIGDKTHDVNYYNDKPLGPFTYDATATTVTILREPITTDDLQKAQGSDKGREARGKMLYRWTVSTASGVVIHSHAAKLGVVKGGWAVDFHINYPAKRWYDSKGICIDKCDVFTTADSGCSGSSSCHPINASATFGISPVFSKGGLEHLHEVCPYTQIDKTCPPQPSTGPEACENFEVPLHMAMLACIHLAEMNDIAYHDACVYDFCAGYSEGPTEDWYREHNPPRPLKCKAVADPRFTTFNSYKMSWTGDGIYSMLDKAAGGATDPCAVSMQMKECPAGNSSFATSSFMSAIGIKAVGGSNNHSLIFNGETCTWDGEACGKTLGANVGKDGVTLIPYVPDENSEAMGDFGPGYTGWFVYSMGFAINVTVTKPEKGHAMYGSAPYLMNVITNAPPMCTATATGLCTTAGDTTDALLQSFGEAYHIKWTNEAAGKTLDLEKKGVAKVAPAPSLPLGQAMKGLESLACP
jgi:hypothetical protein